MFVMMGDQRACVKKVFYGDVLGNLSLIKIILIRPVSAKSFERGNQSNESWGLVKIDP